MQALLRYGLSGKTVCCGLRLYVYKTPTHRKWCEHCERTYRPETMEQFVDPEDTCPKWQYLNGKWRPTDRSKSYAKARWNET